MAGTFDYLGTVPPFRDPPWTLDLRTAADRRDPSQPSLLGRKARLIVEEAGLTPNAGFDRGVWRPEVLRLRFSLTAEEASVRLGGAAFYVDRAMARAFSSGDLLHLSRTACGGLALSAVRSGQLVVAVGAVTAVPLGQGVSARIPVDLVSGAEAVFKRCDPTFELREYPIEIAIDGQRRLLPGGELDFPDWEVAVFHGFRLGLPGIDESLAICRRGVCSASGANASAQLMADGLLLER